MPQLSQQSLRRLATMAWTTVGYHAMEQKFFDELISKDADACILPSLSFASWYRTPLCAISQTRKEIVRKLGVTLSETLEVHPKAKAQALKRSPGKSRVDAALECPNYVVWRLRTQENVAELVSKGILQGCQSRFQLKEPLEPLRPFRQVGKWFVEYARLNCIKSLMLCFWRGGSCSVNNRPNAPSHFAFSFSTDLINVSNVAPGLRPSSPHCLAGFLVPLAARTWRTLPAHTFLPCLWRLSMSPCKSCWL